MVFFFISWTRPSGDAAIPVFEDARGQPSQPLPDSQSTQPWHQVGCETLSRGSNSSGKEEEEGEEEEKERGRGERKKLLILRRLSLLITMIR